MLHWRSLLCIFLCICTQKWGWRLEHPVNKRSNFPIWLYWVTLHLHAMYESSCSSTSSMAFHIFRFFKNSNMMTTKYFIHILTCIPLTMMPFHIGISNLGSPTYESCVVSSFLMLCHSLNILDTNPLLEIFFS